jgi:glycogen synthase kinase 3 beta
MCHPFFDELRDPNTRLPDSRHPNNPPRELPNLFDFSRHGMTPCLLIQSFHLPTDMSLELSMAPELNSRLVPPHARAALEAKGLDIDNFTPISQEEMRAHLDWTFSDA